MGCGVSSGPNAHQPQPTAHGRAVPAAHATVVQPHALPHAAAHETPTANATAMGPGRGGDKQIVAPIIKSLVYLHRDSVGFGIEAASSEAFLSFRLDCRDLTDGCDVSVHYMAKEDLESNPGVPTFGGAGPSYRSVAQRCRPGLRQTCKLVIGTGLDVDGDVKKPLAEKDGFFHIVIDITARGNLDANAVTRQTSYAKLSPADDKWSIALSKQKTVCGGLASSTEMLYGNFPRRSSEGGNDTSAAGDGAECVICLTNPRDTVIIPCRHVCLCSTCANVSSSTWSFQCPVCRSRVSKMVRLGAEISYVAKAQATIAADSA